MSDREPEQLVWDLLRGSLMTKALGAAVDTGVRGSPPGGHPETLYRFIPHDWPAEDAGIVARCR